jgi:hypothetical protein
MSKRKKSTGTAKVTTSVLSASDFASLKEHEGIGFENVTINEMAWVAKDLAKIRQSNKLDRDLVLHRILRAVVDANPRAERKNGDGSKIARVYRARAALLGSTLKRGRRTQVNEKTLDLIAKKYFEEHLEGRFAGSKAPLDKILKDILLPNRHADKMIASTIENKIKSYRKAFKDNKDWLLLRNSQMLDMPVEQSSTEKAAIKFLVYLTK